MSDVRLLTTYHTLEVTPEMIKESREEHGGKIRLRGILQKSETLNQNGRVYPRNILEREIRNYQKFIIENRALGELDHPNESVISFKNASHIIREAKMDGDVVHGMLELLNTPSGRIAQDLVNDGVKIGISSRGVGSTKKQGDYHVVQDDYQLICWDLVSEPSTPGAFMIPEGKSLTEKQLNEIRSYFTRSDRIDRILNEILLSFE